MAEMFKSLFFSIFFLFHPVHVTLTSIDYIPGTDSFKVFVRMYFDDFLRDHNLDWEEIRDKDFSGDNSDSREVMRNYLEKRIIINVNDKQLSGKLQRMEIVDNEISMNLEYSIGEKPERVTVKNLVMTALYSDQANMLIVRINDFEEGVKLTADVPGKTFILK